jgi:hypothetical protein
VSHQLFCRADLERWSSYPCLPCSWIAIFFLFEGICQPLWIWTSVYVASNKLTNKRREVWGSPNVKSLIKDTLLIKLWS